jgi:hypothetical protein
MHSVTFSKPGVTFELYILSTSGGKSTPTTASPTPSTPAGATPTTLEGASSTLEATPSANSPPSAALSSSPTYGSDGTCLNNDHDDAPLRYLTMKDLLSEPHLGLEQI